MEKTFGGLGQVRILVCCEVPRAKKFLARHEGPRRIPSEWRRDSSCLAHIDLSLVRIDWVLVSITATPVYFGVFSYFSDMSYSPYSSYSFYSSYSSYYYSSSYYSFFILLFLFLFLFFFIFSFLFSLIFLFLFLLLFLFFLFLFFFSLFSFFSFFSFFFFFFDFFDFYGFSFLIRQLFSWLPEVTRHFASFGQY